MPSQKLSLSQEVSQLPEKWQPKYLIKRIGEKDILISQKERNMILKTMNDGERFVQLGEYTLMLNSIKSIDPLWGPDNIPPRPELITSGIFGSEAGSIKKIDNSSEIAEWDRNFINKKLEITGGQNDKNK